MSQSDGSIKAKSNSSRAEKAAQGEAYSAGLDNDGTLSRDTAKLYKSFMQSYVKRINDSTYRVPIEGIRIGSAKYSRLAQINLRTRIITFSRFAIENVPERGRRYLVLHELAHVLEASHNKTFWHLVGQFEPDYKDIGISLDQAFKQNVESFEKTLRAQKRRASNLNTAPRNNPVQLKIYNNPNQKAGTNLPLQGHDRPIIWTPDHGYVEPGSQRFGLHKDPKEFFFGDADKNLKEAAEEAYEVYEAYLDLKEQGEEGKIGGNCIFDADSPLDQAQDLNVYEDEEDFDLLYGTISGGDF